MGRRLKNPLHFLSALMAAIYFRFPGRSMKVIGITGTDGKSTTTHLVYEILKAAKMPVSMVSTIAAQVNGKTIDTGFHVTTPSPWDLQKLMRKAVEGGSQYFILEVTSHALDQFRTWGTSIDIGVITNISHEHLDYHKTLGDYREAKSKILDGVPIAILNMDDSNFTFLDSKTNGKVVTFSLKNRNSTFNLSNTHLTTRLPGTFNLYNCLAAYSVAKILNISDKLIQKALKSYSGITGRMEEIKTGKPFRIIIDFAHKPNALKSALETIREKSKKIILVFGCAGLRDRLKRPMMGKIAGEFADYTILTAEDPRTEDVRDIIEEIAKGCRAAKLKEALKNLNGIGLPKTKKYFWRIPDRQEAINFAVRKLANRGDVILITGKGHEKSMCWGETEHPWDEKLAIQKALYGSVKTTS